MVAQQWKILYYGKHNDIDIWFYPSTYLSDDGPNHYGICVDDGHQCYAIWSEWISEMGAVINRHTNRRQVPSPKIMKALLHFRKITKGLTFKQITDMLDPSISPNCHVVISKAQ